MTNPFEKAATAAATATAEQPAAPAAQATPPAPAETKPDLSMGSGGDPFASPVGLGGDRIVDMVDRLLLVRPLEIVPEMSTVQGKAYRVVRSKVAILDDPEEPGRVADNVLLFQQALKREATDVFNGPKHKPYLLARLSVRKLANQNTLYEFLDVGEAERRLAAQFLEAYRAANAGADF